MQRKTFKLKSNGGKRYRRSLSDFYKQRSWTAFKRSWPSPDQPIKFRRMLEDGLFYSRQDNNELVAVGGVSAATPTWVQISGTSADAGNGFSGTYQTGFTISLLGLTQVVAAADFQSLFNEYQISKLELRITLENGDSAAANGGSQGSPIPHLYWVNDPNDASPTPYSDLSQFSACKDSILSNQKSLVLGCTPRPAQIVYSNSAIAASYGYNGGKNMWIDTTGQSFASPHYSFKFVVRNMGGSNTGVQFRITPVLYFSMRRPK